MSISELMGQDRFPEGTGSSGHTLWVRIQLSRNIAGYSFPHRAEIKAKTEVLQEIRNAVAHWNAKTSERFSEFSVASFSLNERELLKSKRLLPDDLSGGCEQTALFINEKQNGSLLVNGQDHLRIQYMTGSPVPGKLWEKAESLENQLGRDLTYAFDHEFGFLTASPYLTGTGLRYSAALFLPGLVKSGAISGMAENAARQGFSLRSLYGGSDRLGSFCELSNTVTLGVSEAVLTERMEQLLSDIEEAENMAWQKVFRKDEGKLKDQIWRALGTLKYARIISREEAVACAGLLHIGIMKNLFPARDPLLFPKLILTAGSGCGRGMTHKETTEEPETEVWRAVLLRNLITEAGL